MEAHRGAPEHGGFHVFVRVRIFLREAREHGADLRLRFLDARARSETPFDEEPTCTTPLAARLVRLVKTVRLNAVEGEILHHRGRHPVLGTDSRNGARIGFGRDADDVVVHAAQPQRLSDHIGVPAEAALPEAVAQDHHGMRAFGRVFL